MPNKTKRHLALAGVGVSFDFGQSFGGGEMTVCLLYSLHPKSARRESVCNQTPMYNNRGLCGFRPHLGHLLPYGGVNICNASGASVGGNPAYARAKFGVGVSDD